MIQLNEYTVIKTIEDTIKESLPPILKEVEAQTGLSAPMYKAVYGKYIDPLDILNVPAMSIIVDKSTDKVISRAIQTTTMKLILMSVVGGQQQYDQSILYNAAIAHLFGLDPTLQCSVLRGKVTGREYFPPFSKGNTEIRVSQSHVEIVIESNRL